MAAALEPSRVPVQNVRLMSYDHRTVEPKWQARWKEARLHRTPDAPGRPKYYVLDMFPYPSGAGLHVGHPEGYTATDIITRWKRMQGWNVLHPMGWDAFGLPAEQLRHQAPASTRAWSPPRQHRELPPPDQVARLRLRLGPRDRHDRPGVREVDAVDLPPALQARPGLPGYGGHQLVPGVQDRARQRRGQRGPERALRQRRRAQGHAAVDAAHHRATPTACSRTWRCSTGPSRRWPCSGTGSAAARAPR